MTGPQVVNGHTIAKTNDVSITEIAREIQVHVVLKPRHFLTLPIRLMMISRSGDQKRDDTSKNQKGRSHCDGHKRI